jgi:cytochrome P450
MNLSGDMMDAAWNLGLWTLPCAALFVVSFSILLPIGRWQTRHVPGYLGWPMVGNLLDIQRLTWHGFHEQGFFTFGGVFRMFYGADPHIVVASAESVRHVLKHCPHVFEFPVPFGHEDRGMLLDGLAFARDSKYHSRLRSAWLPSFSPTSLSLFQECFEKKSDELVRELKQLVSAEGEAATVEIWKMLSSVSFSIIASTGFGLDMPLDLNGPLSNQSKSHARRVLDAFHKILEASSPDKTGIWLPIFLMVHPSFRGPIRTLANLFPDKTMRMLMKSQKELREIAMELIQIERAKDHPHPHPQSGTTEE